MQFWSTGEIMEWHYGPDREQLKAVIGLAARSLGGASAALVNSVVAIPS
jgi:hypothetical protein